MCVGYSIFNSVLVLFKFIFLFHKKDGVFDFKMFTKSVECLILKYHNPFKNENNRKTAHSLLPDVWFLSYNKKFENSLVPAWVGTPQKPKTGPEINFLNLEIRSVVYATVSQ